METIPNATVLLLGLLLPLFYSLKRVPEWVFEKLSQKLKDRFIFRVVVYDYDEFFYVLEDYFSRNYPKKYQNLEASFERTRRWVAGIDSEENAERSKRRRIYWKQEPNFFSFRHGGRRIYVSKNKKELEHATDLRSMLNFHYTISCWRGKKYIQKLLEEITRSYNDALVSGKVSIYSTDGNTWKITGRRSVKTIDRVIMDPDTRSSIVEDLDRFKNNRIWYDNLSIVYKRSYLLYGPPGTGKTTTAQAIASYTGRDVCVLNLSSVSSDNALVGLFATIPDNSLLLIEDIDGVFRQRTPTSKDIKITFSCLLNCLDGVISREGIITVITTNHINRLDDALIRPGRVDMKIEMPYASNREAAEYMNLFYGRKVDIPEEISIGMSAVQDSCMQYRDNPKAAIECILTKSKPTPCYE